MPVDRFKNLLLLCSVSFIRNPPGLLLSSGLFVLNFLLLRCCSVFLIWDIPIL